MKRISLVKLGGMLMVALGTLFPLEATAFPFETTPDGFTNYLNGLGDWSDGTKREFFNPRQCDMLPIDYQEYIAEYDCNFDYRQSSSLGTRTCINANVRYYSKRVGESTPKIDSASECSDWEKVSTSPEPQSQPIPPRPQPQISTTTSTTLNNNLILAGGAGIFVAGGLLGVTFCQLLGRRKRD